MRVQRSARGRNRAVGGTAPEEACAWRGWKRPRRPEAVGSGEARPRRPEARKDPGRVISSGPENRGPDCAGAVSGSQDVGSAPRDGGGSALIP